MPLEFNFVIFLIVLNFFIVKYYKFLSKIFNIFDIPNEKRKIHKRPTPILGGILIYSNILIFFLFYIFFNLDFLLDAFLVTETKSLIYIFIIITLIFFIGIYDDKYSIKGINRLILISSLIYFSILIDLKLEIHHLFFNEFNINFSFEQGSQIFPLICFIVLIISCNLGDGINFQSFLFNFFCFLALYLISNNFLILVVLISLIYFGLYNYKGLIFLGDSGSYMLSFILGFFFIKYYNYNLIENVESIVLFLFFPVLDATRCILIRLFNGRNIMSADNIHLHYMLLTKIGFLKTSSILSIFYLSPFLSYFLKLNPLYTFVMLVTLYLLIIFKFSD